MKAALPLLLLLALIPGAAASAGTGTFVLEGATLLPQGAEAGFTPLALHLGNSTGLRDVRLEASRAVVYEYWESTLTVGSLLALADGAGGSRRVLRDPVFTLENASEEGHFSLYPERGADARFLALSATSLEARARDEVSSHVSFNPSEDPHASSYYYYKELSAPHVAVEASGALLYEGRATLKFDGADLRWSAEGASGVLAAGYERTDPTRQTHRWYVIELEDARLRADARTPWTLAAPAVTTRWMGSAVLTPREGEVTTREGRFVPPEGTLLLTGDLLGVFAPAQAEGRIATRMQFAGDVDTADMRLAKASLAARLPGVDASRLVLLAGVAVTLTAGFGAGVWLTRTRRAARREVSVEDCMAAATRAADAEDWPVAAEWLRRVRRLAPTSARTCADLAHALCQMEKKEEALRLYAEASRLSQDGEADFNGALLALEMRRPTDEVESWLERALRRSPQYVVDVEGDPAFRTLRGRPRFERAVTDAWRHVEDADPAARGA